MDQITAILIEKYTPMWTNKQIWEFEQTNQELKFDILFVDPKSKNIDWKSKLAHPKSDTREVIIDNFDYLSDGFEVWISNSNEPKRLDEEFIPYIMAVMADIMIDEEIALKFRMEKNCLIASIDFDADVIDCKEFFEEFYHLATGINYDADTGIPDDETEAEMYLTRLQDEFDQKMTEKLGDKYLPGNNDPDSINAE